jgi:diguanylate cyclase
VKPGGLGPRIEDPAGLEQPLSLRAVSVLYSLLGFLLVGYVVMLVIQPGGQLWSFLSNWGIDGFEVLASCLCILLSWAVGDVVWSIESQGGATPATPSLADLFYLAFYLLAYIAVILLMRQDIKRIAIQQWLDAVVAGAGAAAVTAAFGFDTIVRGINGSYLAMATDFAYPIGDLILVALAVGVLAILPSWRQARWLSLALGYALAAVGDTIYLFQASSGSYRVGTLLDGTWPAALLLLSYVVWLAPSKPTRPAGETTRFVVSVAASVCGLAVLVDGSVNHVSRMALALATVTLLAVIARLLLSLRELRTLTESRMVQALTDELTGLGNRRHLTRALEALLPKEGSALGANLRLALLLIDLDHFKELNDSFGHAVGDEVLKMLGPRLRQTLRSTDILARLGGDEFGIVLSDHDASQAVAVAERVTLALEESFQLDVASLRISASIGIALVPDHAVNGAELFRCADVAMYRAKLAKHPFEVYERGADQGRTRRQRIEQLRLAIEENTLELSFQPQFDLRTGEVPTVEALLRWQHPELGTISPLDFLPLAEEAGLMKPLGDLVLESALAQCSRWRAEGHHTAVSVNMSTANILDVELAERIRFMLARHRLGSDALIVEITEATLMRDRGRSQRVVERLHDLGVAISIDDFGSGASSLAYLSELPVSELKIDGKLVARLAGSDSRRSQAIVRSTIELGHSLDLRVVAEGVEDARTYELLASMGCDLAQGFFLGGPQAAERIRLPWAGPSPLNVTDLRLLRHNPPG